eukprot:1161772-Pelagomonas_calceolata.AAC.5
MPTSSRVHEADNGQCPAGGAAAHQQPCVRFAAGGGFAFGRKARARAATCSRNVLQGRKCLFVCDTGACFSCGLPHKAACASLANRGEHCEQDRAGFQFLCGISVAFNMQQVMWASHLKWQATEQQPAVAVICKFDGSQQGIAEGAVPQRLPQVTEDAACQSCSA